MPASFAALHLQPCVCFANLHSYILNIDKLTHLQYRLSVEVLLCIPAQVEFVLASTVNAEADAMFCIATHCSILANM
jgi:hypothetical protein